MHYSRAEIGEALKLSDEEIRRALTRGRENSKANFLATYEARLEAEQFKIDAVEREAWRAWRATAEATGPLDGPSGAGNPKFLQILLDCHAKRARLLGLNLPESLDLDAASIVDQAMKEAQDEIERRRRARVIEGQLVAEPKSLTESAGSRD